MNIAKKFLQLIYERIVHGDEQHRAWLQTECSKLEEGLLNMLKPVEIKSINLNMWSDPGWDRVRATAERLRREESDVSLEWYDVDMMDDPSN